MSASRNYTAYPDTHHKEHLLKANIVYREYRTGQRLFGLFLDTDNSVR